MSSVPMTRSQCVQEPRTPTVEAPEALETVEQLLCRFDQLDAELREVREGLVRSHRLATLGTIAAVIAHEYNNILTPIISYGQLALASPGDAELMRKAVEKSLAGAERAAGISASLLGFAREADEGHVSNLARVVEESLGCLARDPRRDGIEVALDIPADLRAAMAPGEMQQVLVNLILNARKAIRAVGRSGTLAIRAHARAELVVLEVRDTGPGIPSAIRSRLFEPFVTHPLGPSDPSDPFNSDRTPGRIAPEGGTCESMTSQSGTSGGGTSGGGTSGGGTSGGGTSGGGSGGGVRGTGLGLHICRELVQRAGGWIECQSEAGRGTTFRITLPRADDLFAEPDRSAV